MAGRFRTSEKNLGVASHQIPLELKKLCDDALYWLQFDVYGPNELAVRFKHRLVSIHCFSNGNGRHSRLMADIVIENTLGKSPFSWGAMRTDDPEMVRRDYIQAMKAADRGDFAALMSFARS